MKLTHNQIRDLRKRPGRERQTGPGLRCKQAPARWACRFADSDNARTKSKLASVLRFGKITRKSAMALLVYRIATNPA